MNHTEFTAELREGELYNSLETGWQGANIHQTQIRDYLPQLDLTKRNTPWTGQTDSAMGTYSANESLCLACQDKPTCLFPPWSLSPQNKPSTRRKMSLSAHHPHATDPASSQFLETEESSSSDKQFFYEQHLIIRPFKMFCIINLGRSGER